MCVMSKACVSGQGWGGGEAEGGVDASSNH